jgi:hypothetical protein
VDYSAGNGVVVNGTNDTIQNCLIEDVAYAESASAGIMVYGAGNAAVTRNTIAYVGSAGISASAWGHSITYNNIHDHGIFGLDIGAGIYAYTATGSSPNSVIAHNIVHDTQSTRERASAIHVAGGGYGQPGSGLYFDLRASAWTVAYNVVYREQYADVLLVGGSSQDGVHNDLLYHNTLADADQTVYSINASYPSADMSMSGTSVQNNILMGPVSGNLRDATVSNNLTYPTDPRFVDGYHLQSTSPAIDQGIVIPGINDGYVGAAPDEGAYEYGGTDWTAGCGFSGC